MSSFTHTIQQVLREQTHGATRCGFGTGVPGGAGDIQVCPFVGLGKSRQEAGRRDAATLGPADIGDVGEITVELLLIVVPQRHLPGPVVRRYARCEELLRQVFVVGVQPTRMVAEGHDAGAGQRGDIDHAGGLEALRVGEGIAKYQASSGFSRFSV